MTVDAKATSLETYINPVYPRSFPDPFVIKFRGEYYAYCTDFWRDSGRVFGVLRSRDLVNWTEVGGAMQKLESDAPFYWAPEVTYADGKFYLYYSVGNETLMELRVAVSNRPDGGFVDSGKKLSTEDFAIDAHVFIDTDGQKYLFYATDFLDHSYIGTGTVVDKMIDFFTLAGDPRPVTRARYDWQVYDPQRKEKGGVRWHTVEGPFVLKRKGVYYEMFSGGNWQNITYGVSFAVTRDISQTDEWTQFSDGEKVLPILRTIPDLVVGPGHNCAVRGLNNREWFCVYHRWTEHGRTLAIDRMDFAGPRLYIKGATHTPQIAPLKSSVTDFFDTVVLGKHWQKIGSWAVSDNETVNEISEKSLLICGEKSESLTSEFSLRAVETTDRTSAFGFCLLAGGERTFEFLILPATKQAVVYFAENNKIQEKHFDLPKTFNPAAYHLLRVEADVRSVRVALDEANFRFETVLDKSSGQIALVAERMSAAFSGFTLTAGYEDLFDRPHAEQYGWRKLSETGDCRVENQELFLSGSETGEAILVKGAAHNDFEFAANLRLNQKFAEAAVFGFLVLNEAEVEIARLICRGEPQNFYFSTGQVSPNFPLPTSFEPANYHQFRFLKTGDKLALQLEEIDLGELSVSDAPLKIALCCRNSEVAFEMIRLTVLPGAVQNS